MYLFTPIDFPRFLAALMASNRHRRAYFMVSDVHGASSVQLKRQVAVVIALDFGLRRGLVIHYHHAPCL